MLSSPLLILFNNTFMDYRSLTYIILVGVQNKYLYIIYPPFLCNRDFCLSLRKIVLHLEMSNAQVGWANKIVCTKVGLFITGQIVLQEWSTGHEEDGSERESESAEGGRTLNAAWWLIIVFTLISPYPVSLAPSQLQSTSSWSSDVPSEGQW